MKKSFYYIGGALLLLLVIHQRKNIKKGVMGLNTKGTVKKPTEADIKAALLRIKENFGEKIAKDVEKVYRLETGHFKSTQFLNTYSAGMLKFGSIMPYGWRMLAPFWAANPDLAPDGVYNVYVKENPVKNVISSTPKEGYKLFSYLAFPNIYAGMAALAAYIRHFGNVARWNSTNPVQQQKYLAHLNSINNKFV